MTRSIVWAVVLATAVPAVVLAGNPKKAPAKKATPAKKAVEPPADKDAGAGSATKPDEPPVDKVAPTATAPAPAPAPAPPPTPAADSKPEPPADKDAGGDVDQLRQEYLALRDELFKSRARAATVASQLYTTRVAIKLTYTTGRYYNPTKVSIRLDGASVYDDATGAIAKDDGVRFEGYVAPGRHVVTFRVEATGKDDDSFTSMTETQLVVKAVAGKDLVVSGRAHDSGDIAYAWKREEHGNYGLGIDTAVKAVAAPKDGAKK